jgi:hypothetical protein
MFSVCSLAVKRLFLRGSNKATRCFRDLVQSFEADFESNLSEAGRSLIRQSQPCSMETDARSRVQNYLTAQQFETGATSAASQCAYLIGFIILGVLNAIACQSGRL